MAALSHPGILAIHDFGRANGVVYAVMELLEGETLRSRLDSRPARLAREPSTSPPRSSARSRAAHEQGHRAPRRQAREHLPDRATAA